MSSLYSWFALAAIGAFIVAVIFCILLFIRLIRLGKPKDFSEASGDIGKGISYSFIGAMSPKSKESAYLHLPTYAAGIVYHIGTFVSLLLFVLLFFPIPYPQWMLYILSIGLGISTASGIMLFIKRLKSKELRQLSSPDDYLSNGLTTLFQLMTAIMLIFPSIAILYYFSAILLLIYIPIGKLKHLVYFFSARYHLGFFYGRRNSWPVQKGKDS